MAVLNSFVALGVVSILQLLSKSANFLKGFKYPGDRFYYSPFFLRFDLGATSLKGLCGTVGCCHCMKLLHNSTEAPIAGKSKPINGSKKPTAKKPSAKKPGAKRPIKPKPKKPKPMKPKPKKPKSKKPKPMKPKPKKPKSKRPKSSKPKPKKPKSKKPKSKKPKSKKPKSKKPMSKKPQLAKETKTSQRNQS